jgi:flagellar capping protein FliD
MHTEVTSHNDDTTAEQDRLNAYADQLRAQFTAMDTAVSGFKNDQSYLTRLFSTS